MTTLTEIIGKLENALKHDKIPNCGYFGLTEGGGERCSDCPAFGFNGRCNIAVIQDIAAKLREIASEMEPIAEGDIVRHPDAACDLKVANVFDIDGKPMLTASHVPDGGYAPIVTISDFAENFARA